LLGDGLLTVDEDYHDRARAIMMPAFHREQVAAAMEAMTIEAEQAIASLPVGAVVDVYEWMRNLAMRIAMRALLGLDPDEAGKGAAAAEHFERALGYYGIDFHLRLLRGPGSPWRKLVASREVLDQIVFGEISRRRADPDSGRRDILSLLVGARGAGGEEFSDREIRDQVMTLMFAGHDTSTSTLTFMLHELARHPDVVGRLQEEQDRVLGGADPTPQQLEKQMPYLEMVLDEVLRLYPPAWIGPRRAIREFEFGGHTVPKGAYVNYCSWASHRLPEVFPQPEAFIPERFTRERKAALLRGAYVPFGGGSRICIGKRFGQTEVKLVATMLLQRLRLEALPGRTVTIRQMPTLSPRGGLRMRVQPRG
jgi:cytochrome P450